MSSEVVCAFERKVHSVLPDAYKNITINGADSSRRFIKMVQTFAIKLPGLNCYLFVWCHHCAWHFIAKKWLLWQSCWHPIQRCNRITTMEGDKKAEEWKMPRCSKQAPPSANILGLPSRSFQSFSHKYFLMAHGWFSCTALGIPGRHTVWELLLCISVASIATSLEAWDCATPGHKNMPIALFL